MSKIFKIVAFILAVLIGFGLTATANPAPAQASTTQTVRLEAPVRHVKHVKVSYVHKGAANPLWVEFNTGSLWAVAPCKREDSNNCYWSAKRQGNGKGHSFVTLKGKTYRLPIR